jgi:hypothetical protein
VSAKVERPETAKFVVVAAVEVEVFIIKPPIFPFDENKFVEEAVVLNIFVVVPFVIERLGDVSTPVDGLNVSFVDETLIAWLPDAVVTQVKNILEAVVVSSVMAASVAEPALPVAEAAEPLIEPLMVLVTERLVVVAAVVVESPTLKKANVVDAVHTFPWPKLTPIVLAVEPL